MNNHRGGCRHRRFIALLLLGLALHTIPQLAHAESASVLSTLSASDREGGTPARHIDQMDRVRFPTREIVARGTNLPAPLPTLSAQDTAAGNEWPIDDGGVPQPSMQLLLAIDINDLSVRNQIGQSHYVRLVNALNQLFATDAIVSEQDWLAAYWLAGDEPAQILQPWTQHPELVLDTFIANRPPTRRDAPLSKQALSPLLTKFAPLAESAEPRADPAKAILLFSAGDASPDVVGIAEEAQAQSIKIYVVELRDATRTDGSPDESERILPQLAAQTGGHSIALTDPAAVAPLVRRLTALRTLPDGATLAANSHITPLESAPIAPIQLVGPTAQRATPWPTPGRTKTAAPATPTAAGASQSPARTVFPHAETVNSPRVWFAAPVWRGLFPMGWGNLFFGKAWRGWFVPLFLLLLLLVLATAYIGLRYRHRRRQIILPHAAPGSDTDPSRFQLRSIRTAPTRSAHIQNNLVRHQILLPLGPSIWPAEMDGTHPRSTIAPASCGYGVDGGNVDGDMDDGNNISVDNTGVDNTDHEATVLFPPSEDDNSTLCSADAASVVMGHLVCVIGDPRLSKELPIYKPSHAPDGDPSVVQRIPIGRHGKENTIVIREKSISRKHAVLVVRHGQLYVRDDDSTSGTFLNWRRLNPDDEILLCHKDLISFGQITYEYHASADDEDTMVG